MSDIWVSVKIHNFEKTGVMDSNERKYDVPIRAVERTINILQAINRNGAMTLAEIARAADIPYPTATRFVLTLIEIGVIEKSRIQKKYLPTALSKTLSCGYKTSDPLVDAARPHLLQLTKKTGWPSAIHMRVGGSMVMLDSTHSETTQAFSDYYPGYSMPITACAAGLAYLAYLNAEERAEMLQQLSRYNFEDDDRSYCTNFSEDFFKNIVDSGYATFLKNPHSKDPGKSSSIGVALHSQDNVVVGAVTLVFFSSALQIRRAVEKYLDDIIDTQLAINKEIAAKNVIL